MIIESGFIILFGFLALFIKLPKRTLLHLLSWPLAVDLTGSVLAYVIHAGTFSGLIAAAVAGLMLSACTSIGRFSVGYIDQGKYVAGHLADWSAHAVGGKP
jgi:hypothetical protein